MKKNILLVLLGMIIMLGIGVIADNLNANEVDYRDTKVDQALDTLYERSTYTEYSGSTEVTPSTSLQTLSTNDKLLKSNITINAIPSTFKELTQTTTATANDLLSGKTAYDNNGNLITGTGTLVAPLTITLGGSSSSRYLGIGSMTLSEFSSIYHYFKITSVSSGTPSYNQRCDVTIIDSNGENNITINTQYDLSSYTTIFVRSESTTNNSWNNCIATVQFYN